MNEKKLRVKKSRFTGFEENGKSSFLSPFLPCCKSGELGLETEREGTSKNIFLLLDGPDFNGT